MSLVDEDYRYCHARLLTHESNVWQLRLGALGGLPIYYGGLLHLGDALKSPYFWFIVWWAPILYALHGLYYTDQNRQGVADVAEHIFDIENGAGYSGWETARRARGQRGRRWSRFWISVTLITIGAPPIVRWLA